METRAKRAQRLQREAEEATQAAQEAEVNLTEAMQALRVNADAADGPSDPGMEDRLYEDLTLASVGNDAEELIRRLRHNTEVAERRASARLAAAEAGRAEAEAGRAAERQAREDAEAGRAAERQAREDAEAGREQADARRAQAETALERAFRERVKEAHRATELERENERLLFEAAQADVNPRPLWGRLKVPACSSTDVSLTSPLQATNVSSTRSSARNANHVHPERVRTWTFDAAAHAGELRVETRQVVHVNQNEEFQVIQSETPSNGRCMGRSLQNVLKATQDAGACTRELTLAPEMGATGHSEFRVDYMFVMAARIPAATLVPPHLICFPAEGKAPRLYPVRMVMQGRRERTELLTADDVDMERFYREYESGVDSRREPFYFGSPIAQEHTYMCVMECKYGMLTTGLHTWFMRRVQDDDGVEALEISQDFRIDADGSDGRATWAQACAAFILMVLDDEESHMPAPANFRARLDVVELRRHSAGGPKAPAATRARAAAAAATSSRGATSASATTAAAPASGTSDGANELPLLELERFVIDRSRPFSGMMNHGAAYRMDVGGYDSVLKIVYTFKDAEGGELFRQEADMYWALRELWGVAVPPLVIEFCAMGIGRDGFVTAYAGRTLAAAPELLTGKAREDVRGQARAALRKIHAAGYLHGDVARRNLCVDDDGKVLFIDLGHASKITRDDEAELEMQALDDLLADDDGEDMNVSE